MKEDLDKELCSKYPKIFSERYASMQTTAMCWGFECSEGWYNIIDHLCSNIQGHINWREKSRAKDIEFNTALEKALAGDKSTLVAFYTNGNEPNEWTLHRVESDIAAGVFRTVEPEIPQVVAEQVKEKFGGLRFYYRGGDEYIAGLVAMAESMSYVTCEVCGSPGKRNSGGWIRTLCGEHRDDDDS